MNKGITLNIKVDVLDDEINIHVDKSDSINYISDDNKTNIINYVRDNSILRKPTSEEIRLFNAKLKEESLELDFENNLVEKPKVGDLCIFWDNDKSFASIQVLEAINGPNPVYITNNDNYYKHCIKFNSEEQFKKLINEKV